MGERLHAGQLGVMVGYAVIVVAIGVRAARGSDEPTYLIARRSLGALAVGSSVAASKIAGGLIVTYSALFFAFGASALWFFVGSLFGYGSFYLFARRLHARSATHEYYTPADYFRHHHGARAAVAVGLLMALMSTGLLLVNVTAAGNLLGALSGLDPRMLAIVVCVSAATYVAIGGFQSVVATDVVQLVAILVVAALAAWLFALAPDAGVTVVAARRPMAAGQVAAFFAIGLLLPFSSADLWQRVYAARSPTALRSGIAVACAGYLGFGVVLSFICLRMQALGLADPARAPELVLPLGIAAALGSVLYGLWLVAYLSAVFSTVDSLLFAGSMVWLRDVLARRHGARPERRQLRLGVLGLTISCAAGSLVGVDVVWLTLTSVAIGCVAGSMALVSWLRERAPGAALTVSCLVGSGVVVADLSLREPTPATVMLAAGAALLTGCIAALANRSRLTAASGHDG